MARCINGTQHQRVTVGFLSHVPCRFCHVAIDVHNADMSLDHQRRHHAPEAVVAAGQLPPAAKDRPARVAVLDGLRLVAALMVATFHYTGHDMYVNKAWGVPANTLFGGLRHFSSYGWMGVELFFLISGFVICMSSWGRTAGSFARSRLIRLFPAYWPAVLITTAVVTVWPVMQHHLRLHQVLINLTMLQEPAGVKSVDGAYWTLWVEARFYLLFAVAMLVPRGGLTKRRVTLFGYGWLVAAVLSVNAHAPILGTILQPQYAPLFVAGIAFFLIFKFKPDITLWGLVALAYLLAVNNQVARVEYYGPANLQRHLNPAVGIVLISSYFAVLTVISLGWTSRIQWRWLTTAGLLTYPFYLLHQNIGLVLIYRLHGQRLQYLTLFLVIIIMLVAAWLLHRLVERPVAGLLKRELAATLARDALSKAVTQG